MGRFKFLDKLFKLFNSFVIPRILAKVLIVFIIVFEEGPGLESASSSDVLGSLINDFLGFMFGRTVKLKNV